MMHGISLSLTESVLKRLAIPQGTTRLLPSTVNYRRWAMDENTFLMERRHIQ